MNKIDVKFSVETLAKKKGKLSFIVKDVQIEIEVSLEKGENEQVCIAVIASDAK